MDVSDKTRHVSFIDPIMKTVKYKTITIKKCYKKPTTFYGMCIFKQIRVKLTTYY